ncbi:DNA repair protein rad16, partial [Coemansia sp. IMI 209127]
MVTTRASSRRQESSNAPPAAVSTTQPKPSAATRKRGRKPTIKPDADSSVVNPEPGDANSNTVAVDSGVNGNMPVAADAPTINVEPSSVPVAVPNPDNIGGNPDSYDDEPLHKKPKIEPLPAASGGQQASSSNNIATTTLGATHGAIVDSIVAPASAIQETPRNTGTVPVAAPGNQQVASNNILPGHEIPLSEIYGRRQRRRERDRREMLLPPEELQRLQQQRREKRQRDQELHQQRLEQYRQRQKEQRRQRREEQQRQEQQRREKHQRDQELHQRRREEQQRQRELHQQQQRQRQEEQQRQRELQQQQQPGQEETQQAPQEQKQKQKKKQNQVEIVRPRNLPEDDIDYSSYSKVFFNHPHLRNVWSSLERSAADKEVGMVDQPADLKMHLLPFQREGVWWMTQQESTMFRGGILADEMGMGKTLQTIALLLLNRGKPTLVVCPTVALMQWKAEIEKATDSLSVFVFYGNDRKQLVDESSGGVDLEELAKYDVILTTYAVMESGFRREHSGFRSKGILYHEPSLLHRVDWFRLVLDEAHNIKDRSSNSARAAFALKTQRVWALTGTPLHNRVGELFSLIRLTKADPFSRYFCHSCDCSSLHWNFSHGGKYCDSCGHKGTWHFCFWNLHILKPVQLYPASSQESRMAFRKLGCLLDNIMLRRTKIERSQDLGLPPRIVTTRRDRFSPAEEELYVSLFKDYKDDVGTFGRNGTILNNYANVFELITRMRLAANHPDLLRLKVDAKARIGNDTTDTLVCSICNEEAEDPIMSRCKHVFCRVDAQMYVNSAGDDAENNVQCPTCFAEFKIDLEQPEMRMTKTVQKKRTGGDGTTFMDAMLSTPDTTEYKRSIVNRIDMRSWKSSTKIEALVEELSRHRRGNANIKSIVFSQFVNFLDLIQWRLNRAGFSVCRLDGRMSPTQRDAVIRTFMTHPEYTVFLVSLKAGGVALNLTEASHVYLADVWWNPSVETQAMDRIHRMGQYRPIKVTRLIVENSIESRIAALQEKKQNIFDSTIGRDRNSLDRLSHQDM